MVETIDDASAVALDYLRQHVEPQVGEPISLTSVRAFPTCWVAGYNTAAYIETGTISHGLAGGPLIINRSTGAVRLGRSDLPAEDQLDPE